MDYCYTLKDFETIALSNKMNIVSEKSVLSSETLSVIKNLCEIIGVPTETSTFVNQYNNVATQHAQTNNTRPQKDTEYRGDKYYKAKKAKEGWKSATGFKVSKFAELENNDAIISEIRTLMNKLTETNQATKIPEICEKFSELGDNEDDMVKALNIIYTITISNTTYMNTYINVWNKLYEVFPDEINTLIASNISEYEESMKNIVDVDSENYDEFCEFTAKNTKRKNITSFLCKLVSTEMTVFTHSSLLKLIETMVAQIDSAIEIKSRQKEVEELSESIVIIFSAFRNNTELYETYLPWFRKMSGYKTGEKPGLPPRSKFKYMDLIGK